MTLQTPSLLRSLLLAVLLLGLAGSAAAQQRQRMTPADRQVRLAEWLSLDAEQQGLVEKIMGEEPGPGTGWALAAELAPTLTDTQKERLFAPPQRRERPQDGRRADRPRGERRERPRGERRQHERPNDEARAAHRDAMKQAMVAALDLTDQQVARLDALHEERRARREEHRAQRQNAQGDRAWQNRPAPVQVPDEVAEILTEEQEAIWAVHHALMRHARPFGGRPHGGR